MSSSTSPVLIPQLSSARGELTNRTRTLAYGPLSYEAGRSELLRVLPPSPSRDATPARVGAETLVGMPTPRCAAAPGVPALSRRTVVLVQHSWSQILPFADMVAALFFERLFELDPPLHRLFQGDVGARKKGFVQTVAMVVAGLNAPATLIPILEGRGLGARLAGDPRIEPHAERIREALLWALREGLRDDFTGAIEEAWAEACAVVWGAMKQAAVNGSADIASAPQLEATVAPAREAPGDEVSLEPPSTEEPPPAPLVEALPPSALAGLSALRPGARLTALCIVASVASTILLGMSGAEGQIPVAGRFCVPLLLMILVFGAFRFGQLYRPGARAMRSSLDVGQSGIM